MSWAGVTKHVKGGKRGMGRGKAPHLDRIERVRQKREAERDQENRSDLILVCGREVAEP